MKLTFEMSPLAKAWHEWMRETGRTTLPSDIQIALWEAWKAGCEFSAVSTLEEKEKGYTNLERAAIKWFEGNRSCGMSMESHLRNPKLNCRNNCDDELAMAVASKLKK